MMFWAGNRHVSENSLSNLNRLTKCSILAEIAVLCMRVTKTLHQHLLLRAPHPRLALRGGPLVPPWQGGLLGGAVVGHLLLVEGGVHLFDILGGPLLHGGRKTYSTPVAVPGVWCTTNRASNL